MSHKTPAIMLQGTASSVGKTLMTAALCRILLQEGYKVAPFKAQNMSNNSWVTLNGEEIARSQVVQAQAAKVEPDTRMNPILLKPTNNRESQVVLNGKPIGTFPFGQYAKNYEANFQHVCDAYDSLSAEYDVIVMEGAGCSAEVNLMEFDLVNMNIARHADASVFLVGDIDRGGVFASFVGMMEIFNEWQRDLVKGYLVNRFRGDEGLLKDALTYMEDHTGKPVVGVVPMIPDLKIPEEDGVQFAERVFDDRSELGDRIDIALIALRHVSNFTDVDALRFEDDVRLRVVWKAEELGNPDLVIIPGSKSVVADMNALEESGVAKELLELAKQGRTEIVGICGGLQILGREILDPKGIESSQAVCYALSLLDLSTQLEPEKTLLREKAKHIASGKEVFGYRIHHGVSVGEECQPAVASGEEVIGFANDSGNVWGTYLHGIFDDDSFRRWFINRIRERKGMAEISTTAQYSLESEFDRLADTVREHLNLDKIIQSIQ